MSWTLLILIFSVIFMTVFFMICTVGIIPISRLTKADLRTVGLSAMLGLFLNMGICLLFCRVLVGNRNLPELFPDRSLAALGYGQFFDMALMLLTMYVGSALTGLLLNRSKFRNQTADKTGKLVQLFLSSFLFLTSAVFLSVGIQEESQILISEFYLPDKKTTLEYQEAYLELSNRGGFSCEIDVLYLSDDRNNLQKVPISPVCISSGSALMIPIDDNAFSFGSKGGDVLILSNKNGEILDEVITGDTRKNKSYARNSISQAWEYRDPSPGVYNLEKPEFSVAPGFYDESFYVKLSAQDGADIYYTWDGSTPTIHSEKYTGKILVYDRSGEANQVRSIQNVICDYLEATWDPTPVPKATVLRAIAVNQDGASSEIATATYFVGQEQFKDNYVVSLAADPEEMFGPQGIYSTGEAYDQWYLNGKIGEEPTPNFEIHGLECAGNFELFHGTPQGYLNQRCGLRVQGGSNREGRLKRLSIFSREEYSGSKFFDQNIFGSHRSHSAALREGFENAVFMELVPQRTVATQSSIPVSVFLNGEFWYDTYLQEKYSDEYFEQQYQLEEVEFYKAGVAEEMLSFVNTHDMQSEEAYEQLNALVDIQSYIDFMCANIYLANTDYTEATAGGNSAIWRSRKVENSGYGDGRWRWALYDLDLAIWYCKEETGLQHLTDAQLDTFTITRPWTVAMEERPFYAGLKQNPQFRKQFVLTFMDLANTCFAPETVEPVLAAWGEDLEFNNSFFRDRKEPVTGYLADAYDLTGTPEDLVLDISDPSAGWVQVNTCKPDLKNGPWTGTYYTDYPVTLTAEAREGYRFLRWEGDICTESPEISFVLPEGGASVRAVYEPGEK